VIAVADGDTITVLHDRKPERVRFYRIDAPGSSQWCGQNAKRFTSSQVLDKTVTVDPVATDRCGRTVGIVSVGALLTIAPHDEHGKDDAAPIVAVILTTSSVTTFPWQLGHVKTSETTRNQPASH
jgi:hypothetical protein